MLIPLHAIVECRRCQICLKKFHNSKFTAMCHVINHISAKLNFFFLTQPIRVLKMLPFGSSAITIVDCKDIMANLYFLNNEKHKNLLRILVNNSKSILY